MSGNLSLDAESLYSDLLRLLQPQWRATDRLVGITSGGAWLAERLKADLGTGVPVGVISSAMHRAAGVEHVVDDPQVRALDFKRQSGHATIGQASARKVIAVHGR